MIDLARHIEILLLENDCVIVPGLGGFVAHATVASRHTEESLFLPPARVIGFNPVLKMNDGLLVQSYMAVHGVSFNQATRLVDAEVKNLLGRLHEEGIFPLQNIGELRYSISGTFDFTPYEPQITTPRLYGLGSFQMKELGELVQPVVRETIKASRPMRRIASAPKTTGWGKRSYWTGVAAMVAAVALFFSLSTPLQNTEITKANYAQMLPYDLFQQMGNHSVAVTPIRVKQAKEVEKVKVTTVANVHKPEAKKPVAAPKAPEKPVVAKVAKKPVAVQQPAVAQKTKKVYHIIVASMPTASDAEKMAKQLVGQGHASAKAMIGEGKSRVSIANYSTEAEAYQALNKVRETAAYKSAWVLKR